MIVFAVIVTYNAMRRNWIHNCLMSIKNSTIPIKTIVVDNGSVDNTEDFIIKEFPDVVWMPQNKNLGFGQANNIGIKYAIDNKADFILLLNQDAKVFPDTVEKLIKQSDNSSIISPLHLNGDGTKLDLGFLNGLCLSSCNIINNTLVKHKVDDVIEVDYVNAACWLIPVEIINVLGGFNPLFFHYGEDDNYIHRIHYHMLKIRVVTDAFMIHDRKEHGNEKIYNNKRLRRDFILIETNINLNWKQRIREKLKLFKKCYFKYLPLKLYFPPLYTYELLRTSFLNFKFRKSRNIEIRKNKNWL